MRVNVRALAGQWVGRRPPVGKEGGEDGVAFDGGGVPTAQIGLGVHGVQSRSHLLLTDVLRGSRLPTAQQQRCNSQPKQGLRRQAGVGAGHSGVLEAE